MQSGCDSQLACWLNMNGNQHSEDLHLLYQVADLLPDADSKANVKQPRPRVSVLVYSSDAAPVK